MYIHIYRECESPDQNFLSAVYAQTICPLPRNSLDETRVRISGPICGTLQNWTIKAATLIAITMGRRHARIRVARDQRAESSRRVYVFSAIAARSLTVRMYHEWSASLLHEIDVITVVELEAYAQQNCTTLILYIKYALLIILSALLFSLPRCPMIIANCRSRDDKLN